jgi:hypothetical protein
MKIKLIKEENQNSLYLNLVRIVCSSGTEPSGSATRESVSSRRYNSENMEVTIRKFQHGEQI